MSDIHDNDGGMPNGSANESSAREALVNRRRIIQKGKKPIFGPAVIFAASVAIAGGVFLFGPANLWQFGSGAEKTGPDTSGVNMAVEEDKGEEIRRGLDLAIPEGNSPLNEAAEREKEELNKRIAGLEKLLKESQTADPKALTLEQVQALLEANNRRVDQRLSEEKERNDALRERQEAAARAEEAARRAREATEEARRLSASSVPVKGSSMTPAEKLDAAQRASPTTVYDQSAPSESAANVDGVKTASVNKSSTDNEAFLAANVTESFEVAASKKIKDPSRTIVQGTIITGVLETAVNTELPGNIRAQVTEPVFSFDGEYILMPAGTTLIGTFSSRVSTGQSRVLIAWNRAITPDGHSVALGSTGTDTLGRSGTEGNVDNRFLLKFGSAALISTMTALPEIAASMAGLSTGRPAPRRVQLDDGTTISVEGPGRDTSRIAGTMTGGVAAVGEKALEDYLGLPPIIRIPQGEEIRIFVNRDLVFR